MTPVYSNTVQYNTMITIEGRVFKPILLAKKGDPFTFPVHVKQPHDHVISIKVYEYNDDVVATKVLYYSHGTDIQFNLQIPKANEDIFMNVSLPAMVTF